MRLAWFSPMPPVRSGIAACSAELVEALSAEHEIDVYVDTPQAGRATRGDSAHDFVWRHGRHPYDLTVFQLGNSSHHDYMWPYVFRYPGLAVLHDAHLHHARAAALLRTSRADHYRSEFAANHPTAPPAFAEVTVQGFDSYLHYFFPMHRLVVEASRLTAVHTAESAAEIREEVPGAAVRHIHLGHGVLVDEADAAKARAEVRRERGIAADAALFGLFGGLTPEKRIPQVLAALAAVLPYAPSAHLLLAGPPARHYDVAADVRGRGLAEHVTLAGYLDSDAELTRHIAACDVVLNLRWPTAREMSGPWLRALAAGRATVIIDLAHVTNVPSLDPRTWTVQSAALRAPLSARTSPGSEPRAANRDPVTAAIDILDEDHSLRLAMRRLAADRQLRDALGTAGQRYWQSEHSLDVMLSDYREVLREAAARPAPRPVLPAHLVDDGSARLRSLLGEIGIEATDLLTAEARR